MPIYEFYCSGCDKPFEVQMNMSDKLDSHLCPDCGSESVRTYSSFGFSVSQRLKELKSSICFKGTSIKVEDAMGRGIVSDAKKGDTNARRLLGIKS